MTHKMKCEIDNHVIFKFSDDAIQMGSYFDIMKNLMAAIHHVNINTIDGTYCAVTFPDALEEDIGTRAVIFGSKNILESFQQNNYINDMTRKGLAYVSRVRDSDIEDCNEGIFTSKVRDVAVTNKTLDKVNRRREKRGHEAITRIERKDTSIAGEIKRFFCMMKKDLFITLSIGRCSFDITKDFMVNSYGVSSQSEITVFPKM